MTTPVSEALPQTAYTVSSGAPFAYPSPYSSAYPYTSGRVLSVTRLNTPGYSVAAPYAAAPAVYTGAPYPVTSSAYPISGGYGGYGGYAGYGGFGGFGGYGGYPYSGFGGYGGYPSTLPYAASTVVPRPASVTRLTAGASLVTSGAPLAYPGYNYLPAVTSVGRTAAPAYSPFTTLPAAPYSYPVAGYQPLSGSITRLAQAPAYAPGYGYSIPAARTYF